MVRTRLTPEQRVQVITLANQGVKQVDIARKYGVSEALISYHITKAKQARASMTPAEKAWDTRRRNAEPQAEVADEVSTLSPQQRAWITRRKAAMTPAQKAWETRKAQNAEKVSKRTRKVAILESFTFNGTVKVDKELLKYLHRHPSGTEVTFAKTKAIGRPKKD
jgi:transposase